MRNYHKNDLKKTLNGLEVFFSTKGVAYSSWPLTKYLVIKF